MAEPAQSVVIDAAAEAETAPLAPPPAPEAAATAPSRVATSRSAADPSTTTTTTTASADAAATTPASWRNRMGMLSLLLLLVGVLFADETGTGVVGGRVVWGADPSSSSAAAGQPQQPPGGYSGALPDLVAEDDPRGPTVAALMTVFRNPKAVLVALGMYRDAYPEGDVVLIGDDGCFNYTALGRHFGVRTIFAPERISTKTLGGLYMQRPQFDVFRRILQRALPFVRSRWVFILDTDAIVYRRVVSPLEHDINGLVPLVNGWLVGGPLVYAKTANPSFSESNFPESKVPYGGQGGSIFSVDFLRFLADMEDADWDKEMTLMFTYATTQGTDQLLCALAYRFDFKVGDYGDYINDDDNDRTPGRIADGSAAVVHLDKSAYKMPLSEEDEMILGPGWSVPMVLPPQ
jgi:hypothetical protein